MENTTTLISQGVTETEFIATVVLTTDDEAILPLNPIGGNITFRFWAFFTEDTNPPTWVSIIPLATTTGTSTTFVDGSATFNLFVTIEDLFGVGLGDVGGVPFLLSTPYKIVITNNASASTFPETAQFIPKSLTICFQKGTQILTPDGYKAVEEFIAGDFVTSTKSVSVPIKSMVQFIGKKEDGALYCLPKGALGPSKPLNDLYMSGEHAFKTGAVWKHMKCSAAARETDNDNIEYYHLILDDYFAHTILAEGVEVETCFEDKGDGILMSWVCNEKYCKPLKCEFKPEDKFKVLGNKKRDTTFMI